MRNRWLGATALVILVSTSGLVAAGDWPQFRGPGATGVTETALLSEWSTEKNIAWRVEIPGTGWSCPIVVGDKVFVTTAVTDNQPKPRAGGGFGGGFGGGPGGRGGPRPAGDAPREAAPADDANDNGDANPERPRGDEEQPPMRRRPGGFGGGFGRSGGQPPSAVYRFEVHCLDSASGRTVWKQVAAEHKPTIPTHSTNTYASETPLTDGERIYAYFGMHGLFCYDLQGELVWKKDLGTYPMQNDWGTGSSPAISGERIFIQCDNEKSSFLVALDTKTGGEAWRVERDERSSWSTPFVWKHSLGTQIVTCGSKRIRAYNATDGKVAWELSGLAGGTNASAVASGDTLYVGAGGRFGNSPLFAVKATAQGDISLKSGETKNDHIAWSRTKAGPSMASPLIYDGLLYILEQRGGMISCYDAATGEPVYYRQRIEGARGFVSSPWASGGKIYCLDDNAQTTILKAGREFSVISQNPLDEMCWSTPAIDGGAILLRTVGKLYCIR